MLLDATTKKIQIKTDATATTTEPTFVSDYADVTTSGGAPTGFISGSQDGATNGTTQVDAVSSPGSGVQRRVRELSIYNADTVVHTITISFNDNGTLRTIQKTTLAVGGVLTYIDGVGWTTAVIQQGVIAGGTTGQVLEKNSGTDYDLKWATVNQGQVAQATHPFQQPFGTQTAPASAQNSVTAMPIALSGPMVVDSITFRSGDTSGAKSMEWQLFYDNGTTNLVPVTGASGTLSWTATAVSTQRASVSGAAPTVPAGHYWLLTRVTSAGSIAFGQATNGQSANNQVYGGQTKSISSTIIGSTTIDFTTGWTKFADFVQNYLIGRIAGTGTPWA